MTADVAFTVEDILRGSYGLTERRDGYAVIRQSCVTSDEDNKLVVVIEETVVGYCQLPSRAVEVAAELTTTGARTGERYVAVHGDRADRIRRAEDPDLFPVLFPDDLQEPHP